MISQNTLRIPSLYRSYQHGWEVSLREFNSQQPSSHHQQVSSARRKDITSTEKRYSQTYRRPTCLVTEECLPPIEIRI
ncbi:MAG: hypothetical protein WBA23_12735 [Tunicatimonas sp.]|uniref:hypothetical protein n=1 Tax=Tunicatimonas sp. TaxID=1940096 RepID=UPI003C788760